MNKLFKPELKSLAKKVALAKIEFVYGDQQFN